MIEDRDDLADELRWIADEWADIVAKRRADAERAQRLDEREQRVDEREQALEADRLARGVERDELAQALASDQEQSTLPESVAPTAPVTDTAREPLISARQAAAMLHVSESTFRRLVKDGAVPAVSVGRRARRYRRSDVLAFIDQRTD